MPEVMTDAECMEEQVAKGKQCPACYSRDRERDLTLAWEVSSMPWFSWWCRCGAEWTSDGRTYERTA